jgi:glycerophosphoryl diester phosphodiesterase
MLGVPRADRRAARRGAVQEDRTIRPGIATLVLGLSLLASVVNAFDLQGHRGARGLAPENTLSGFAAALSLGVTTLEFDVGVTADGVVVVSHDRRLNPAIVRDADGSWLPDWGPALRELSRAELETFDVGRLNPANRYAARFPDQTPDDGARVPSLAEVIALTRKAGNDRVRFNMEPKLSPLRPDEALEPEAFARAVLDVLESEGVLHRATIQSFDWRTLRHVQRLAPAVPTAYLTAQQSWMDNVQKGRPGASPWTAGLDVDAHQGSIPRLVAAAGGKIWSPYHKEVDKSQLDEAHSLGLAVIVWTVDSPEDMRALIDLGVDGIITDYPDRLRRVLDEKGIPLPPATPVQP